MPSPSLCVSCAAERQRRHSSSARLHRFFCVWTKSNVPKHWFNRYLSMSFVLHRNFPLLLFSFFFFFAYIFFFLLLFVLNKRIILLSAIVLCCARGTHTSSAKREAKQKFVMTARNLLYAIFFAFHNEYLCMTKTSTTITMNIVEVKDEGVLPPAFFCYMK